MRRITRTFSSSNSPEITEREQKNRRIARRAAAEGIVLLKNEGILPLSPEKAVALYGAGAGKTVKGGTGSGDVNEREAVSIFQGLKDAGFHITSESWIRDYDQRYQRARMAWKQEILEESGGTDTTEFFQIYSSHAFHMPEGRRIEKVELENINTAIYVISRIAGENADRFTECGDYYLSEQEKEDLHILCTECGNVIVILNAGGQIDVKELEDCPQIKAVLFIGEPGMEGGHALADILTGHVVPCGKLTDTWAKAYEDFPNADSFSHQNGNTVSENYQEGIYTGYRYFDSFGVEPLYPFGFGLSYTAFDIRCDRIEADSETVSLEVTVKNIGKVFSGKEVIQVYCACPQEGLTKEAKRLCSFAKTKELRPGESQSMTVSFPAKAVVSYNMEKSAWVAEAGRYILQIGNSSRDLTPVGVLNVEKEAIIEKVAHICPLQVELQEITPEKEALKQYVNGLQKQAEEEKLPVIPFGPQAKILRRRPVNEYGRQAAELVEKLTTEELIAMVIGEISKGQSSVLGAAGVKVPGSAGETSSILDEKWDVPGVSMADGLAGLRLIKRYSYDPDTEKVYGAGISHALEGGFFADDGEEEGAEVRYQYCTAIPVGTVLAQTWNLPLLEEVGKAIAVEMQEFKVSWWLAPGMNIHRNPFCGRNFEYYSEDPPISGMMAASITKGVQSVPGVGTVIKHFACNNQEDNRKGSDSILSERALREIYLRGFEIAVRTSQPMAIMTSYNLINGVHAANSLDLCTTAAREEWDFQGIIMTDWTTTYADGGSIPWKCAAAGNDLIMPGCTGDFENIRQALKSGELKEEKLRECVRRIITVLYQTLEFEDCRSYPG
ncbi:beta-glucosidase [Petralouisia muris]|uniref:Beta-glucosidase n=2 Tax=Petralouisia muris TaxID=3032872 RepID=A0AC61RPS6_9FIRM|nr:glycoside hydrolase family 3 protein [Petralouisia muris]TGY87721.1 beta-glucosidase [Petralouisia muris]